MYPILLTNVKNSIVYISVVNLLFAQYIKNKLKKLSLKAGNRRSFISNKAK